MLPFPDPCPLRVVYALNYNIRETDLFATRVKYYNEHGLSYFRAKFFCKRFPYILYDNEESRLMIAIHFDNCTSIQTIYYVKKDTIVPKISLKQLMCFHPKKKYVH